MKRWKSCIMTLLLAMLMVVSNIQPVMAAPEGNAENYTYTVTLYSGKQSNFRSRSGVSVDNHSTESSYRISGSAGSDRIKITGLEYGDVVSIDAQSCVQLGADSKYYVGGVRGSGRDNNTVSASAFSVDSDRDYVIAYAIKGNMVSYIVNYVDGAGNPLLPSQTYYGAVGDKPVVAFRYIENYIPLAYNLTKTLSVDASQNVFTFVYEYVEGGNTQNVVVIQNDGEEIIEYVDEGGENTTTTVIYEDANTNANVNDGNGDGDVEGAEAPLDLVDLDNEDVPLAFKIAEQIAEFVEENTAVCISGSVILVAGLGLLVILLKRKKKKKEGENEEAENKKED